MKPLRKEFWEDSKVFIEWCTDEELQVLTQKINKELERRIQRYTGKFEASEDQRKKHRQKIVKRKAKAAGKKFLSEKPYKSVLDMPVN